MFVASLRCSSTDEEGKQKDEEHGFRVNHSPFQRVCTPSWGCAHPISPMFWDLGKSASSMIHTIIWVITVAQDMKFVCLKHFSKKTVFPQFTLCWLYCSLISYSARTQHLVYVWCIDAKVQYTCQPTCMTIFMTCVWHITYISSIMIHHDWL